MALPKGPSNELGRCPTRESSRRFLLPRSLRLLLWRLLHLRIFGLRFLQSLLGMELPVTWMLRGRAANGRAAESRPSAGRSGCRGVVDMHDFLRRLHHHFLAVLRGEYLRVLLGFRQGKYCVPNPACQLVQRRLEVQSDDERLLLGHGGLLSPPISTGPNYLTCNHIRYRYS